MADWSQFIASYSSVFTENPNPWDVTRNLEAWILEKQKTLKTSEYVIQNQIAIHKSAVVEDNVVLKGPIIIEENCFVASGNYFRNGVFLSKNCKIGPGSELKTAFLFENAQIAHFNYIGDSIVGSNVNFEAGSLIANHHNDRDEKNIWVKVFDQVISTEIDKFGALVGDFSKIGANAVLSPGSILEKKSIVKRLELVEQIPN